jgi:hypothetical protein
MTAAEKAHGFISRSQDADPWLANVRAAVAREAASYGTAYPEGEGAGLRYTAFERHAALARRSLERLREAQASVSALRASLRPGAASEDQLREFNSVWDRIPWTEVRDALHGKVEIPEPPAYSQVVDRASSGQEELLIAFQELFSAPTSRHALALLLAAFIDVIVFLLAYASGPFVFGAPETRWLAAAAAVDGLDPALFARSLVRKAHASASGLPRLEEASLSDGERQLLLLLASHGLAASALEDGRRFYLLEAPFHRRIVESLSDRTLALRAAGREAAAGGTG